MKGGRKNLRRACEEGTAVTLAEGESIMQVVTLRGSNLIEVTDGEGVKSLALFPAKFQTSFWIKNGNFVVVDASGRDEALESGSRSRLSSSRHPMGGRQGQRERHRRLRKSTTPKKKTTMMICRHLRQTRTEIIPFDVHSDTESDSDS
ncbi:hypothetical protein CFC21_059504 [Triticum aestivum]|uniref:S1-like domain-containing protein n=2 Tax=Triticum aestivum TaxID=4565 RepID=A0A3B6IXD4_WHEAT|nr:hypothetical protein CFC21_059504 [Triticum aestivum]